jgi:hypothetical protein
LRLEPEAVQLGPEHAAHFPHAFQVACAAVDVDDPLDERQRLTVVPVDIGQDRGRLVGVAVLSGDKGQREWNGGQRRGKKGGELQEFERFKGFKRFERFKGFRVEL